ncbi:formylglycine-generating enzyme family protein [Tateyamaria armeniaca]|uniref:Formylglycine-generating enzyme family protein n=1 Tax=Tateyamaria armeniaca TaxID=2518930 RepID=A0ABW8UZ43_9RHOB
MTAATRFTKSKLAATGLIGFGVAAAAIWVALSGRGPDRSYLPDMTNAPIVLSDGRAIYVQRFEVTIAEWNICVAEGACALPLRARPDQDATITPATGLSYVDVRQYVDWINDKTGQNFRLPTATEWAEMAAPILPDEPDPIFTDPALSWASTYLIEGNATRALKPQGSFSTSPHGVADLDGSVWEWTQDCYAGSAQNTDPARCPAFFVGGEHIAAMSYLVRDPARGGCAVGSPPAHLGMRLVSDTPL